jgi:hypothetical protein
MLNIIMFFIVGITINASTSYWIIFWIYAVIKLVAILCRFLYNLIKD